MNRDEKAQVVERIAGEIESSDAIFALDYRGLSVRQAAELRAALVDAGASFRVVKNTLTERAADRVGAESLKQLLDGPTALTFVRGDVALAAKAIATFRRRERMLEIKGGQMNGEPLSTDEIDAIARLPARDALNAQFVGVLAAPLTGLVRGLGSLVSGLAIALRQVEERGLVGGAEPAPAAEAEAANGAEVEEPAAAEPSEASGAEAEEPAAEAPDAEAEQPAPEAAEPSEAPGDPVAEAQAAEDEAPSEGESESQEG